MADRDEELDGASFPTAGLVPKDETNVLEFLRNHPEYNGHGVVVAVFDTGVDMGAEGMTVTPDGKTKVVDVVECSGSGDVDMSTVVRANADGSIDGIGGRKLLVNPKWVNPSGQWRVGVKAAFELFSAPLVKRLKQERQDSRNEVVTVQIADARSKLAEHLAAHPSVAGDAALAAEQEELKAAVAQLELFATKFEDTGPVFDCIVFHDGSKWQAAVDSTGTGDFTHAACMTNYRELHQYSRFSTADMLNYAVNIYDDGAVLSIVTDAGAHGTHVAGIIGAYYPEHPELNGIAPGVQIVSLKIGDTRLGSMETSASLARALRAVIDNGCDMINMSYGEGSGAVNVGRFVELANQVVNERNVIFVASAGNEGPCLTTTGAPGGTTASIIGVGALVSPAMMEACYSALSPSTMRMYTWSGRGPAMDGALGVSVCAPGAAITSVPQWTLQRNMMMNGTSMAAPNACGCIALVLSGLKAESRPFTPHSIRRSIENTAQPVNKAEVFACGQGLVQVDAAFEHARRAVVYPQIQVNVEGDERGVYIRDANSCTVPKRYVVNVQPVFHKAAPREHQVDFQLRALLISTATWVSAPRGVLLMNGGRQFSIQVDPTGLAPGAHYAEVRGYDANATGDGPVFRVPITIVRPLPMQSVVSFRDLPAVPGELQRVFLQPPPGATWADVIVRRTDSTPQCPGEDPDAASRLIIVQANQVQAGVSTKQSIQDAYLRLLPAEQRVFTVTLNAGAVLEICIGAFWVPVGTSTLSVTVNFHGVCPDTQHIMLHHGDLFAPVTVKSGFEATRLKPTASLTHSVDSVAPDSSTIVPTARRYWTPIGTPVYCLKNVYSFSLQQPGAIKLSLQGLHGVLYEGPLGAQMVLVTDEANRVVGVSDAFPGTLNLKKGKFTATCLIKHTNVSTLEPYKSLCLSVQVPLAKPVSLTVCASAIAATTGGGEAGVKVVLAGGISTYYVRSPAASDVPKGLRASSRLTGSITFEQLKDVLGATGKPSGFPVSYIVGPAAAPKSGGGVVPDSVAAIRDARISVYKSAKGEKQAEELAALVAAYPDALSVRLLQLNHVAKNWLTCDVDAVVAAADEVLSMVDVGAVAAYFGVNHADETTSAHTTMVANKDAIIEALLHKARALCSNARALLSNAGIEEVKVPDTDAFTTTVAQLREWVKTLDGAKYLPIVVEEHLRKRQLAMAFAAIQKCLQEEGLSGAGYTVRQLIHASAALCTLLGWTQWAGLMKDQAFVVAPAKAPLLL